VVQIAASSREAGSLGFAKAQRVHALVCAHPSEPSRVVSAAFSASRTSDRVILGSRRVNSAANIRPIAGATPLSHQPEYLAGLRPMPEGMPPLVTLGGPGLRSAGLRP
jgi:hypothetical protein